MRGDCRREKNAAPDQSVLERTDPLGRQVRLAAGPWEHITKQHPEFRRRWEVIGAALGSPDEIYVSSTCSADRHYYRLDRLDRQGREMYVKVIVRFPGQGPGKVITAYETTERSRRGELEWPPRARRG